MFDHNYCITSFCCLKTLEKTLRNVEFLKYNNGPQTHERCVGFKNATEFQSNDLQHHDFTKFTSMHVTVDDINFCDRPRMRIRKVKKPCINST